MKALILNSGVGKRMGEETKMHPKCMTKLDDYDTILSRQLQLLAENGIRDVIITTGPFEEMLIKYCESLNLGLNIKFIKNEIYDKTNSIYSVYKAKDEVLDDVIFMHGDLVFSDEVLKMVLGSENSAMVVSSTVSLPEKDFKAVIRNNQITRIGVDYFDNALACQPLYKINKDDWVIWLNNVTKYIKEGNVNCYAENAFNDVSEEMKMYPLDIQDMLCGEIDNLEDLKVMRKRLWRM